MTHDEAMEGEAVSFACAKAELARHGYREVRTIEGEPRYIEVLEHYTIAADMSVKPQWERVELNSRAILEWLGY